VIYPFFGAIVNIVRCGAVYDIGDEGPPRTRTVGIRRLLVAREMGEEKPFRHITPRRTRTRFLEFCRYPALPLPAVGPDCDHL
jgi:hypothetical protein